LLLGGKRADHLAGAIEADLEQELHLISLLSLDDEDFG
jgi:hypothetical protein